MLLIALLVNPRHTHTMNSIVNRANRQVTHIKNDLNNLREALEINSNNSKTLTSKT